MEGVRGMTERSTYTNTVGDTYEALQRHVGRLMSQTPNADPQFLAWTFICAEIDNLKKRMNNACPQVDPYD